MKLLWNCLYFVVSTVIISLFSILYLPLSLIIIAPYLKVKKNISIKEFWQQGASIYVSVVSSIYPFIFLALPTFCMIKRNAKKIPEDNKIEKIDINKIKKGDVILTGKNSWGYSQPIQLSNILSGGIENRYWTHACIYAGSGNVIEAQCNGKGVIETDINNVYIQGGFKVKVLRHKFLLDQALHEVVQYCENEKDKNTAYDTWGVSFYVLASLIPPMFSGWLDGDFADKFFNVKDAYFCSELVADAFKEKGYDVFGMKSWRVKPLDFFFNPIFEEIDVSL